MYSKSTGPPALARASCFVLVLVIVIVIEKCFHPIRERVSLHFN